MPAWATVARPMPPSVAVTPELLRDVARLAQLSLSPEEESRFAAHLQSMLAHFDTLEQADTEDLEPMRHGTRGALALRPDEPSPSLDRDVVLAQAPAARDGHFSVPPILE